MNRLHVHVAVDDLTQAVRFYSTLFAAEPSVLKSDDAKWMLDDPRVNFAISARGAGAGIEHLGIQVEDAAELEEVYGRLRTADARVVEEGHTTCCYARSEKSRVTDPAGVFWEVFRIYGDSAVYGGEIAADGRDARPPAPAEGAGGAVCCTPAADAQSGEPMA